jgi:DNA-binding FrmR family transcriptional regulator
MDGGVLVTEDALQKRDKIIKRLNRIEGQVKGIKKMVEGNICCSDVLIQVSAVRAAVGKVGTKLLELYSESCIDRLDDDQSRQRALKELLEAFEAYIKFGN